VVHLPQAALVRFITAGDGITPVAAEGSAAHPHAGRRLAPHPGGDRALPSASAAMGTAAHSEVRGDEDFAGLRAYEAGVPLKHMAWKVLARGGEPAVRSYTGPAAEPEWLSQLCRWVLLSETAQRAYGLRIPGTEIAPSRGAGHRSACLRALARYPSE